MITCQFENGNKTNLRHLCVNAIVVKNNKILLGKRGTYQGRKILEFGKWGFLGGFLQRDETLTKAIKREVLEEAGWEIDKVKLFRINDAPHRPAEDRQNINIIFIAQAIKKVKTSDEEVTKLQWFNLNNLPSEKETAFDFSEDLKLYKNYLKKKFPLPIWGKHKNM